MDKPRLTVVTLGVRDVAASAAFYERLGFVRRFRATGTEIAFFDAGGLVLALWDWSKLQADAGLPGTMAGRDFRGSTLAWNCRDRDDVDRSFARALQAGGTALRHPEPTDYGGYRGYFADPDEHVWEIVVAPNIGFDEDGGLILPD
jgi:predicted lactoylglutathione lyase